MSYLLRVAMRFARFQEVHLAGLGKGEKNAGGGKGKRTGVGKSDEYCECSV